MKNIANGFSLIELMIVVSIIGILAAIALPRYQDYMARTQASESVLFLNAARNLVEEYVVNEGAFPPNANAFANTVTKTTGTYGDLSWTSANQQAGIITFTFNSSGVNKHIQSDTVTYMRTASDPARWVCSGTLEQKYMPSGCITSPSI